MADVGSLTKVQSTLPHNSAARMNQVQPVRPPAETQHLPVSKYADCDLQVINCRWFYCSLWGGYRGSLQYHRWARSAAGGWHLPVTGGDGCWQQCQGCCSQAQILFLLSLGVPWVNTALC